MSGYKHATVTISQEEYRRLHEADMKKRFTEYSRIKTEDTGQNEVVLNLINQLEERERQLQSAVNSLGQNSNGIENNILHELLNQNSIYYESMLANLRSVNIDLQDTVSSLSDDFFTVVQSERESFNQNLQSIIRVQNSYQDNEFMKSEAAHVWLHGCMTLVDFIQTQFDHERFTPGRLNRILRNLNLAEENLASGFFETSLQASQQMYLELSDLNFELEQFMIQWQTMFESTCAAVNDVIFQMVSNGKVKALDLDGEELPNYVDLNFWTNGRFLQLLEHTRQLASDLIQDQNILTFEDMNRIYNQILPVIRESFEATIFDARLSALNSQLRMNIAEKALHALENHGFYLDRAGYSNNDMRSQFNAHLACPDGSEVTINVVPNEKSTLELSNELVVITTHPNLRTEHEARVHWEELSETLSQYKLRVSRPEVKSTQTPILSDQTEQNSLMEQQDTRLER